MGRLRDNPTPLDYCTYLLVRAADAFFTRLPWNTARTLAEWMSVPWRVLKSGDRKELILDNIQKAFPGMSRAAARRILAGSCRSTFRTAVDGLQFRRLRDDEWRSCVGFRGLEKLPDPDDDRGIIFTSGHFGSWEMLSVALSRVGYPLTTVYRPLSNPLLNRYLEELRRAGGQRVVPKRNALRPLLKQLRKGGNAAFLIDQDSRHEGMFVDFMGRPAATYTSFARLSISTGAPVAFVYAREPGHRPCFHVKVADVVWPRADADRDDEVFRITQRITHDLEELVRQHPGEWMWTQRRWKTWPGKFEEGSSPKPGVLERGNEYN
ncbi:MAG: lysophospholipid acyltransferase family protein [Planctomycetota bacterium]